VKKISLSLPGEFFRVQKQKKTKCTPNREDNDANEKDAAKPARGGAILWSQEQKQQDYRQKECHKVASKLCEMPLDKISRAGIVARAHDLTRKR
jgi:hypothetical protein